MTATRIHRRRTAAAGLAAATLVGCSTGANDRNLDHEVTAMAVERLLLSGEIAAERAIEITVPDLGIGAVQIRTIRDNGSVVAAGETLVELDNSQLAQDLEEREVAVLQAQAALASAESRTAAEVAAAEFDVEQRRAELGKARVDADIPSDLRSEAEYARLQMELSRAERELAAAERALTAARTTGSSDVEIERLALRRARVDLDRLESGIATLAIAAPQPGVVLLGRSSQGDRLWEVGDVVYPGAKLATIPDLSTLLVRARLFDVDEGSLAGAEAATVTLDAYPERSYAGRVRRIDSIALQRERSSTTRVFWVVVDLEEVDPERMLPGMSAKVVVVRPLLADDAGAELVVVERTALDLSDPDDPRARLADGSVREVRIERCGAMDCAVSMEPEPAEAAGGGGL